MTRETHPEFRKGSVDPSVGPGRVGRPTRRSRKGRQTHQQVWERSGANPEVWEG